MELALAGEPQAWPGIEVAQRRPAEPLDALQAGPPGRTQFTLEDLGRLAGGLEQIAIESLESAVDPLGGHDLLDPVDGRGMAFGGQPGPVRPVETLDLSVAVVDGAG
jgi:hypothetical protein